MRNTKDSEEGKVKLKEIMLERKLERRKRKRKCYKTKMTERDEKSRRWKKHGYYIEEGKEMRR